MKDGSSRMKLYELIAPCPVSYTHLDVYKRQGSACGPKLLDAWYHIDESYKHLSHTGLDLIMYGCQHQRWINRPFLLFPLELPEEEKEYYRKYQFQALTQEDAADPVSYTHLAVYKRQVEDTGRIEYRAVELPLEELLESWTKPLEKVFPTRSYDSREEVETGLYRADSVHICKNKCAKPTVFIPVFPGTNCEYDLSLIHI